MSPSPACSRETRRAFGRSGSWITSGVVGATSVGSTFRAMIFGFDAGSSAGAPVGSAGFLRTTFGLILRTFLSQAVFSVV